MGCCIHTASYAGGSDRSGLHQCRSECMCSFEDDSEIETVPDASEFLGNAHNIRDNDSVVVCCVSRRTISCRWLHYGVEEFFRLFIKHQIISNVFYSTVEILLILT
jgi:hypothetical protein